jgi:hypothetical protein
MSTNDAAAYIHDAEIFVDMWLERNLQFSTEKRTDLRFTSDDVPKAIKAATAKFAAFFIYVAIYHEQAQPGLPRDINDISLGMRRDEDLSSWAIQAKYYLNGFIDKYSKFFNPETGAVNTTAPRWRSTAPLFDAVGVVYVGDGMKLPELDEFVARADMTYDGALDWDLLTPYINQFIYEVW